MVEVQFVIVVFQCFVVFGGLVFQYWVVVCGWLQVLVDGDYVYVVCVQVMYCGFDLFEVFVQVQYDVVFGWYVWVLCFEVFQQVQ